MNHGMLLQYSIVALIIAFSVLSLIGKLFPGLRTHLRMSMLRALAQHSTRLRPWAEQRLLLESGAGCASGCGACGGCGTPTKVHAAPIHFDKAPTHH